MARPRLSNAKTTPVTLKLSTGALAHLDRLRGNMGRSTYLRELLRAEVIRQTKK